MICGTHGALVTENATRLQEPFAAFVMANNERLRDTPAMLSTEQLLFAMSQRNIRNKDIAAVLGVDPARVTEIFKGERRVQLDEAKKLVEAFNLEENPPPEPLTIPVARLVVIYLADSLGIRIEDEDRRVEELARDIRAFSSFAADPRHRQNVQLAEGFFQGLKLAPGRINGT